MRVKYLLALLFVVLLLAPWIAPYSPELIVSDTPRIEPFVQTQFILGTDEIGRDLLSRLVFGGRATLGLGFICTLLTLLIGSTLGAMAGFLGGFLDRILLRIADVLMSFPSMLVAVIVVTLLGPGMVSAVWSVVLAGLPQFFRLTRSVVREQSQLEYVQASKSSGANGGRILLRHILPNCVGPLLVQTTLSLSESILNVAALGFLGMGVQAPTPEWGTMLADARQFMVLSPHLVTLPGLAILVTVLILNLTGDELRRDLDPRLRS